MKVLVDRIEVSWVFIILTLGASTGGDGELIFRLGSSTDTDRYFADVDLASDASVSSYGVIDAPEQAFDFRPSDAVLQARLHHDNDVTATAGESYIIIEYSEITDIDTLTSAPT